MIITTNLGNKARVAKCKSYGYIVTDLKDRSRHSITFKDVRTRHCYKTGMDFTWDFKQLLEYMNTGSKYDNN